MVVVVLAVNHALQHYRTYRDQYDGQQKCQLAGISRPQPGKILIPQPDILPTQTGHNTHVHVHAMIGMLLQLVILETSVYVEVAPDDCCHLVCTQNVKTTGRLGSNLK